jgi:hypothetical protein
MEKIADLLRLTREGTPWALARFNDGEAKAMEHPGCVVARGCQKGSPLLQESLLKAFEHRQANYWIGLPCHKCWPAWHRKLVAQMPSREVYPHQTLAVVATNRNLHRWKTEFPVAARGRPVMPARARS